jgi:hypothetical protein
MKSAIEGACRPIRQAGREIPFFVSTAARSLADSRALSVLNKKRNG